MVVRRARRLLLVPHPSVHIFILQGMDQTLPNIFIHTIRIRITGIHIRYRRQGWGELRVSRYPYLIISTHVTLL